MPSERYLAEQGPQQEAILRSYYVMMDTKNIEGILALFSEDITYDRGTRVAIRGAQALRRFYESERQIESGTHRDLTFKSTPPVTVVCGHFSGRLKTQELVEVDFVDTFEFGSNGKIVRRVTEFPEDQREV